MSMAEQAFEKIRDGLEDALAYARSDGWLPIESAPKDGTEVLLFYPLEGLSKTWPKTVIGTWQVHGKFWVFQSRAFRGYSDAYQPTHWMPLPAPPIPHSTAA